MPKLSTKKAKSVGKAKSEFTLLPNGIYEFKLERVNTGEGQAGPYWEWVLRIPEGHEHYPRRLSHFTSLSEESEFKMNETFAAFGVSTDTDTDDLLGSHVMAEVVQRTIQKGERTGEIANSINKLLPLDDAGGGKKGKGKKSGKKKGKAVDDDPPPF
jgi:hypothetical protein